MAKKKRKKVPEKSLARKYFGEEHAVLKKRRAILDAEPLEDPLNISPEVRTRYFRENIYPYAKRIGYKEYYSHKIPLQVELAKLQNSIRESGERLVILFEGRDAAGKGGTIRRFMEHWNPRGARVVALEKPSDVELGQWYFQRYISHFPSAGEIVLFDRSWYNRSGVERVMGFSSDADYRRFMQQVPQLERMIVDSGIRLIKLYFSVSRTEQLRRFSKRSKDPLKQWKISPIDLLSKDKWEEYTEAKVATFLLTHSEVAPWTIIKSDDKMRARINAMRHVLHLSDYTGKDHSAAYPADPSIVAFADEIYTGGAPSKKVTPAASVRRRPQLRSGGDSRNSSSRVASSGPGMRDLGGESLPRL